MLALLVAFLLIVQAYLLFNAIFLYYPVAGALLARFAPRREAFPSSLPRRFAVLIAAHNEEAVIGQAVEAIGLQRYPEGAYDVFVVADNCVDGTAAVARRAVATVLERQSEGGSTKGKALSWLWSQLSAADYDAVVILDADNQASPDFLAAVAGELGRGHAVVQGIRRAKPASGGTAGLDGLTELCTHRIGAAGRTRLGVSGPIMGSGVAYQAALFDRLIRHVGETVVEDCEWQAKLAIEGIYVHWTDRAVIFDEKTARASAMGTQRARWVAGRGQVARAYALPLLSHFVRTGSLTALDMAAFLLTVPRVLALAGWLGFWVLALAVPELPGLLPWGVWFACLAGFGVYVVLGLWLDGAPASAYKVLLTGTLHLPRFAWQMAAASWKALTGAAVKWVPTPHGR